MGGFGPLIDMEQQLILRPHHYLQLSDSTDQVPADTTETQVTFNTIALRKNINVSGNTIQATRSGRYMVMLGGQVGKDSGAVQRELDLWLKVNDVDVPQSAVRGGVTNTENSVLSSNQILNLRAFDEIKVYMAVSNVTGDIGLYAHTPSVGPTVPSVELSMYLIW